MRAQIDRHNTYRQLNGLYFPHHEDPRMPLRSSIVDGELVMDIDRRTHQVCVCMLSALSVILNELCHRLSAYLLIQETLRYLAFDCLVVDDQHVMSRPLDKRYGVRDPQRGYHFAAGPAQLTRALFVAAFTAMDV